MTDDSQERLFNKLRKQTPEEALEIAIQSAREINLILDEADKRENLTPHYKGRTTMRIHFIQGIMNGAQLIVNADNDYYEEHTIESLHKLIKKIMIKPISKTHLNQLIECGCDCVFTSEDNHIYIIKDPVKIGVQFRRTDV
jgi:hypothetical protein